MEPRQGALEGMAVNPAFWTGKRVLVTGNTGFKGSWLTVWLARLGAKVRGFSLPPETKPSLFKSAQVQRDAATVFGDIRDPRAVDRALRAHRPSIVFHLAAQALVRRSYDEPVDTFATNVMGTVHVLEAARSCPSVKAVVVVTSDKCYENVGTSYAYAERDRLGGRDPYSASKACAEIATDAWRQSFSRQGRSPFLATARAGNVLGGGDWAQDRLVPDLVRAFGRGRAAEVRNPDAVRPWQHVLDPLAGYLLLAERLFTDGAKFSGAWNFGPPKSEARTVRWVADNACSLWSPKARWKRVRDRSRRHEAKLLSLDAAKARRQLGWRPRLSIENALQWTVEWYERYHVDPATARRATQDQIARFMQT